MLFLERLASLAVWKMGRQTLERPAYDESIILVACVCDQAGTHEDRLAIYAWTSGVARSTDLESAWSVVPTRGTCGCRRAQSGLGGRRRTSTSPRRGDRIGVCDLNLRCAALLYYTQQHTGIPSEQSRLRGDLVGPLTVSPSLLRVARQQLNLRARPPSSAELTVKIAAPP